MTESHAFTLMYKFNVLSLIAVGIKPDTGEFSMISGSEMMTNGNIRDYISENRANRVRLVQPSVVDSAG